MTESGSIPLEAEIIKQCSVLLILSGIEDESLLEDFCGSIIRMEGAGGQTMPNFSGKTVYLCGDISMATGLDLTSAERVLVIGELSGDYCGSGNFWPVIDLGQIPILIHGVGIMFRRYFKPGLDYFKRISNEHVFQSLTESNKPGKAHRTGIYLTPVERDGDGLQFNLLRCSTNLSGPTENFRANDQHIVCSLNQEAGFIFRGHASLNHVLAQVYTNTPATVENKQTKARISSHADKTKDMPVNGIMAFCTFYDQLHKLDPLAGDPFDFGYKKQSGLNSLKFRLKGAAKEDPECSLPEEFTLRLYPGSVFFMPLSTNRFYTHEIKASMLDADQLPTRLGYVVRCSSTKAVHRAGQTYLKQAGQTIPLEPPTPDGMSDLRTLYARENKSIDFIDYGNDFRFSMNQGDYQAPEYRFEDEFLQYALPAGENLFEALSSSVRFEDLGKGRQGTVIVSHDPKRGTPIVRTTTKYCLPAQNFSPLHMELAQSIRQIASLPFAFNNALVERYTDQYAKMGFHSDQAQDLADDSFIALFSCYQFPELKPSRKLVVKPKGEDGSFEIPLEHNGVVIFSLSANSRFNHKIVLDPVAGQAENQWLGVTYRSSKTFVQHEQAGVFFEDGTPLTQANEEESKTFYGLRRRENHEIDFRYPQMHHTLSQSDLMIPVKGNDL